MQNVIPEPRQSNPSGGRELCSNVIARCEQSDDGRILTVTDLAKFFDRSCGEPEGGRGQEGAEAVGKAEQPHHHQGEDGCGGVRGGGGRGGAGAGDSEILILIYLYYQLTNL